MLAHDVADLVAEHDLELFGAGDLDQARVEHDEGVVHAVRASVHDRRLRNVERRDLGIEYLAYPYERLVDRCVLSWPYLDRCSSEDRVDVLLAEGSNELAEQRVEPWDLLECGQCRAVGWMFPGMWAYVFEDETPALMQVERPRLLFRH